MEQDLRQELARRKLPPFKSREEMKNVLLREEYGYFPDVPFTYSVRDAGVICSPLVCGKWPYHKMEMTLTTEYGSRTLPFTRLYCEDGEKRPLIIYIDFNQGAPSPYYPVELVAERGVNVLAFYYTDAAGDDGDFTNGIVPIFLPEGQNADDVCGKIGIWSFCASRLLDYALTLPGVDPARVGVLGHSRLGKTALLTGMQDERFTYVFPNDSGCCGDALFRGNTGEQIADIVRVFPFWFCNNFHKYAQTGVPAAFDQHYLLACIAPRRVHTGAAEKDGWADPLSQQLSCLAAGEYWEKEYGLPGLVGGERRVPVGGELTQGYVAYHLRAGLHQLSYRDWEAYIRYIYK